MRAAWGEARAASCSPAAAFACSPGAAAPGRPHYAGGLPAAAMASRALVRAGHSPQRFLVRAAVAAPARAALPLSRSYPLPLRSNSSSSAFPRPLFLLLVLILLLLLEDAGAQQGEFFPRSAPRAGPRGPWGRSWSLWGAGCPGRYGICRRAGQLWCASVPGQTWSRTRWVELQSLVVCFLPSWRGFTFGEAHSFFLKRGK